MPCGARNEKSFFAPPEIVPPAFHAGALNLRNQALTRMDAGRDGVAIVRLYRRGATGKSGEQHNGAECGKKNDTHILFWFI
jgi:hypothetical protein